MGGLDLRGRVWIAKGGLGKDLQGRVSGRICKAGFGEGPQASIWRSIQGRHYGSIHREELRGPLALRGFRRDLPIFAFWTVSEFIGESARQALGEDLQSKHVEEPVRKIVG